MLCDEPTASLDKDSLVTVIKELKQLAQRGKAVAVVTHDPRLLKYADRAVEVNILLNFNLGILITHKTFGLLLII